MSVTTRCLLESTATAAAETSVYTSSAKTIIDKVSSYGVAAGTLTLKLVQSGGTAGSAHVLAVKTFAVGEAYTWPEIVGQTLEAGDFISALGSVAAAVNLRISGRTVT